MTVKTKNKLTISILFTAAILGGCGLLRAADKQEKRTLLRVGVYDSRAIAIAYAHSMHGDDDYKELKAEMDKAEAANDAEKIKSIKEEANRRQQKKHLQGFGTAGVHELIEPVRDKLPGVAQTCGVDVIVSKWDFDYQSPDAEVKDVTDEIVKLYSPTEKGLHWIKQMKDIKPVSEKDILEHEH